MGIARFGECATSHDPVYLLGTIGAFLIIGNGIHLGLANNFVPQGKDSNRVI